MNKLAIKIISHLFSITIVISLFTACNCSQKSSDKTTKKEIEQEVKEFVYPLPTSFEVTEMLNRIGASYILTLSNSETNVNKYLTEKSQALNLGVYGADLSYASTYRQRQETMNYMSVSKALIEELNISAAVDPDIIDKIEQLGDDKDALVKIITNSFYNTYNYLKKNDRGGVASIIMAGSWVEGLFIATHISDDTFNNKEMVKIVLDQKKSLDQLLNIMAKDQESKDVKEVFSDLKPLKDIYDSIEQDAITEQQMENIKTAVNELREKIVSQ
ncbi:MAG: hypothetical protein JW717_09750 [Marinilabiliaceae bacterium]|nr:hypothetical protein [Marinilabiliaceae bacterium]